MQFTHTTSYRQSMYKYDVMRERGGLCVCVLRESERERERERERGRERESGLHTAYFQGGLQLQKNGLT